MLREVLTCHVYSVNSSQSTLLHHESRYTVLSSDIALHVYVSSSTQSNWKTGNRLERFRLLCFIFLCTFIVFYRATACKTTHGIVVAILTVCQMRVLWQNEMMHCAYFDTTWKGNHSSSLTPTVAGGRRPFPVKYSPKVTHPLRKTPTSR